MEKFPEAIRQITRDISSPGAMRVSLGVLLMLQILGCIEEGSDSLINDAREGEERQLGRLFCRGGLEDFSEEDLSDRCETGQSSYYDSGVLSLEPFTTDGEICPEALCPYFLDPCEGVGEIVSVTGDYYDFRRLPSGAVFITAPPGVSTCWSFRWEPGVEGAKISIEVTKPDVPPTGVNLCANGLNCSVRDLED